MPPAPVSSMSPPTETLLRRNAVFLLIAGAYLAVWPYFERLNNPNENVRVWMTRAIVEHHTMAIDQVSAEWGYVNDKAIGRGHIYSSKAPGASFAGVPVLWAQTKLWHARGWSSPTKRATVVALRLFTVMLPSIVFLFFFGRWAAARTGSPAARDLLLAGVGAGTMLYPYGVLFVGHGQAAIAGFSSYMLLSTGVGTGGDGNVGSGSGRLGTGPAPARIAWAGALAGAAVLLEYQLLLIAALLTGYAVWTHRRRAIWFVLAALPFAIALGAYHAALFGRPWEFPYGHLENQSYAQIHDVGYHGLAGPRLVVLGTVLFSVSYGLFAFSPFLLLGLLMGCAAIWRGPRKDGLVVLGVMLLMTLFISGLSNWRAGWCVGPRYIAGAVPFLALGLALGWPLFNDGSRRAEVLRAVLGGLIVAAVFLNGLSAAVYPHYPELYDNPVFDVTVPLIREGYVPYGLGWALGMNGKGGWALAPVAALWVAAILLAVTAESRSRRRSVGRLIAVALVAAAFLLPLSRYGRSPSATERTAAATIRALWQPARGR